eukprot:gene16161-7525_t
MVVQQNKTSYRVVRRAGHQGTRYPAGDQAGHDKYATGKQSHNMRNQLCIGTWNVRKMKELGKLDTICREMSRSKIQILGIAETN